jgi:hypothetical protein
MPGLLAAGFGALLAMVLVINGYGEEVGWRGFAWSRLRERHSMAGAAALLGLVWAGWHLPVFWLDTGMRNLGRLSYQGGSSASWRERSCWDGYMNELVPACSSLQCSTPC